MFVPPHKKVFGRVLREYIEGIPESHLILDIGCGLGQWINLVSREWQRKTVGLEVDEQVCRLAMENCRDDLNAGFALYDGRQFPFKDGSFQLAYAHEVIEHVEDDEFFLSEVHRVLDQGGIVILTTPNAGREPLDESVHTAHVRHYTDSELTAKLLSAGLFPEALYWRMHSICGFIDDRLTTMGRKVLRINSLQPSLSCWEPRQQPRWTRLLLWIYRLLEPMVTTLISAEFELLKTSVEARNMIIIARKHGE